MKKKIKKTTEKAFNNRGHNKLVLTFPNGNSISTIWGHGTYSDNHDFGFDKFVKTGVVDTDGYHTFMSSNTVEIMILTAPDKLRKKIHKKFNPGSDNSVIGYLTIDKWLKIINLLAK